MNIGKSISYVCQTLFPSAYPTPTIHDELAEMAKRRMIKVEELKKQMGTKYIGHPANYAKRKTEEKS